MSVANADSFGTDLEATRSRLAEASVERGFGVVPSRVDANGVELQLPTARLGAHPDALSLALAVLCDCCIGTTVHSQRPGEAGVTLDFRLDVLGPPSPEARHLRARGTALSHGPSHGAARADVVDDTGRPVALAIGALAVQPAFPLPPPGEVAQRADLDPAVILGLFDEPELDPVGRLVLPVTPEMNNMRGLVHGGVLAAAALLAQQRSGLRGTVLWFAAEFLWPTAISSGRLTCEVETTRAGRRFRTRRTTVRLPDGRPAAIITAMTTIE